MYWAIEARRARNGPWQIRFLSLSNGEPAMIINQPKLGITNVQLCFPGQKVISTGSLGTLFFEQPKPVPYSVAFGQCLFMDTTFLPGTVTFQFFGHEIELLPRVMIIDHEEHAWRSGEIISLEILYFPGPLFS